jgi:hypothetical protein
MDALIYGFLAAFGGVFGFFAAIAAIIVSWSLAFPCKKRGG